MTEQQTPVMTPPAAPPAAPTGPKKKRKGRGKTIAGILIVAAIAIALVVLVGTLYSGRTAPRARS